MERRGDFYASRHNLVFAKSPFEKIATVSKIEIVESKENLLRIEPPLHKNPVIPLTMENVRKSDLSRLRIFPPSERKEFIQSEKKEISIKSSSKSDVIPSIVKHEVIKEEWLKKEFIKLEKWFLSIDNNAKAVSVIGFRSEIGEMWISDAVLARIDSKRIITRSEMCYELSGPIDSIMQDSRATYSNFIEGFPENWKEIIFERW